MPFMLKKIDHSTDPQRAEYDKRLNCDNSDHVAVHVSFTWLLMFY